MAPASEDDLPEVLGAYRVVRRLATGGTSDVLLARAEGPYGTERPVVLKVLLQELRDDDRFGQMFVREAAAYARLSHPAIVRLYDFFADTGGLVLVLEYIDGLPLHRLMALLHRKSAAMSDAAALFVGWRLFSGLAAAHAAQDPGSGVSSPVIHGDVNPSNVLIPWDGHVKIADFGMAKVTGIDGTAQAGLMKGTYGYTAPEQVRGEAVTVRSDVYAGCVMLWELLAHRKAVVRQPSQTSESATVALPMAFPALRTVRPDLPPQILDAFERGLQPEPARRWLTAAEMCTLLRGVVDLQGGRRALVESLDVARRPDLEDDDDEDEDDLITVRMSGASVFPPVVAEALSQGRAAAALAAAQVASSSPPAASPPPSAAAEPAPPAAAPPAASPEAPAQTAKFSAAALTASIPRSAAAVSKPASTLPFVPRPGTAIAKPSPAAAFVPRPAPEPAAVSRAAPETPPAARPAPEALVAPRAPVGPPKTPAPPRPGVTATKLLGSVSRPPIAPSPPRDPTEVTRPSQPPPTPKMGRMAMDPSRPSTAPPPAVVVPPAPAAPSVVVVPPAPVPPSGFPPPVPASGFPPPVPPSGFPPPVPPSTAASLPPLPLGFSTQPILPVTPSMLASAPPPPITPSPIFTLTRTSAPPSVPVPSQPVFDLSRPAQSAGHPPTAWPPANRSDASPPSPAPPVTSMPWGPPSLAPPPMEALGAQGWGDAGVRPRRPRWMQAAIGSALVALAVFFVLTWSRSRPFALASSPEHEAPPPKGTALVPPGSVAPARPAVAPAPPPAAVPQVEPVPAPAPPPAPPAVPALASPSGPAGTTGTITALLKGGHRVWIDSKIVGQSPASFSVPCGPHTVRVGSHGGHHRIEVPCGTEVFVK